MAETRYHFSISSFVKKLWRRFSAPASTEGEEETNVERSPSHPEPQELKRRQSLSSRAMDYVTKTLRSSAGLLMRRKTLPARITNGDTEGDDIIFPPRVSLPEPRRAARAIAPPTVAVFDRGINYEPEPINNSSPSQSLSLPTPASSSEDSSDDFSEPALPAYGSEKRAISAAPEEPSFSTLKAAE